MMRDLTIASARPDALAPRLLSYEKYIIAESNREDFIRWARTPSEPFTVMPPLNEVKKPRRIVRGFITTILP